MNSTDSMLAENFHLPDTYRLFFDFWLDQGILEKWTHIFTGIERYIAIFLTSVLTYWTDSLND